ncbi:hypothetical protein SBY92_002532 [Candida maltosa Xu316]
MEYHTQVHELTTLFNEYKSYFPKCQLNVEQGLEAASQSNYIELQTHEGLITRISVTLEGWYELTSSSSKSFTTFEALMQSISNDFRDRFGNELTNKLNQLLG